MKKFASLIACFLLTCSAVLGITACGGSKDTVVIWAAEEEKALMETLVNEFKSANPDVEENIQVVVQSVWNAQSVVAKDPEAAADVIMIPHDQVGIMAKQGLLSEIRDGTSAAFATDIKTLNAPATVQQATYDGKVYGFPLTMDTYILYYDKTIFTDPDTVKSVDAMLAFDMPNIPDRDEKAAAFGFRIEDGFYLNMGFFAMGCTLYGENGDDVTACNWNNADGLKFMQYAAKNFRMSGKKFKSGDVSNLATAVLNHRQGACVSGGWEMQDTFQNAQHIGYTTLPSITVDGDEKQLVSFSNSKLYAVNNRSKYKGTASRLAAYVTSEKCQLRFASDRGYYPTNLNAQKSESVMGNAFFQVIRAQLDNSVPVPVIPEISRYWEPAKSLGTSLYNGSLKGDDVSLQAALDTFVASLQQD